MAVMPQRASAAAIELATAAWSEITRQLAEAGAGPGTGPGVPGWSKTGPKRALDPPVERCRSSAGPRTTGTSVSSEAAKSAVRSVRTASSRRGGEIRDSSGPAEKMTCPRHDPASALARYAAAGAMSCAGGRPDRSRPPLCLRPASPPLCLRPASPPVAAPVIILVAASGDSAFSATPSGSRSASCQVTAATARFAQL